MDLFWQALQTKGKLFSNFELYAETEKYSTNNKVEFMQGRGGICSD